MSVAGGTIAKTALRYIGVPYVWGGNSLRQGVDCSGLVQQVYRAYGISLPRTTYDQIGVGAAVQVKNLREGDLVFFDTDPGRRGPDHVGIYIGGGKFVHAPRPGSAVKVSSLTDSYYMARWMGGRRVSGVAGGAGEGAFGIAGGEEFSEPKLSATELAERYGMSYAFFKSQKDLMPLLKEAVAGQWTEDHFKAKLRNTAWWKKNSSSVRKAKVLEETDPATHKAKMEAARVAAKKIAVEMGAIMSDRSIGKLAKSMMVYDWNDQQVANFVGKYIAFHKDGTLGGLAGQAAQHIRKTAYDLGIATTKQSILNHAEYITRGLTTLQGVEDGMRQHAASLYPAFAPQIEAGATMTDLSQPYVQVLADELGLPDTDVNHFHPKIKAALNRMNKQGEPEPMSIADFTQAVRSDPKWKKSPTTADRTMNIGRRVLADMGLASGAG